MGMPASQPPPDKAGSHGSWRVSTQERPIRVAPLRRRVVWTPVASKNGTDAALAASDGPSAGLLSLGIRYCKGAHDSHRFTTNPAFIATRRVEGHRALGNSTDRYSNARSGW